MSNLLINRVHFQISEQIPDLYISTSLDLPFKKQFLFLKKLFYLNKIENLKILGDLSDDDEVRFSL